jgi:hypothetical protein
VAGVNEAAPRLSQVVDLQTEVPSGIRGCLAVKEMQLEAVAGVKPDEIQISQSRRDRQLPQPEQLAVEGAQGRLAPGGERRRNML